jgi:hypothetical protein
MHTVGSRWKDLLLGSHTLRLGHQIRPLTINFTCHAASSKEVMPRLMRELSGVEVRVEPSCAVGDQRGSSSLLPPGEYNPIPEPMGGGFHDILLSSVPLPLCE